VSLDDSLDLASVRFVAAETTARRRSPASLGIARILGPLFFNVSIYFLSRSPRRASLPRRAPSSVGRPAEGGGRDGKEEEGAARTKL
jgi:hypothetical protein